MKSSFCVLEITPLVHYIKLHGCEFDPLTFRGDKNILGETKTSNLSTEMSMVGGREVPIRLVESTGAAESNA